MRPSVTTFNGWLISKLTGFLNVREGFTIEATEYTEGGAVSTVRDSLGFRYEVRVKTLGRIYQGEVVNYATRR